MLSPWRIMSVTQLQLRLSNARNYPVPPHVFFRDWAVAGGIFRSGPLTFPSSSPNLTNTTVPCHRDCFGRHHPSASSHVFCQPFDTPPHRARARWTILASRWPSGRRPMIPLKPPTLGAAHSLHDPTPAHSHRRAGRAEPWARVDGRGGDAHRASTSNSSNIRRRVSPRPVRIRSRASR